MRKLQRVRDDSFGVVCGSLIVDQVGGWATVSVLAGDEVCSWGVLMV
jgi:hypothetical protein